ncbi:ATP synthase subunit I [Alysiella sp.]|uniref:ATP synthase subunit I n=1 Tax=Alysiella sp. TaxID=1872483 RepID=UPI0026DC6A98|nr:ATP synthase subunit I [Alysiella sp.]
MSALAWFIAGKQTFISLLLGGLCYSLPTFLAVFFLNFLKKRPAWAGVGFLLAESLKIGLALFLMIMFFLFYQDMRFIPFFVGLLSVSHFVFLLFLRVHRYGK